MARFPFDPAPESDPAATPDPVVEAYKPGIDRTLLRRNLRRTAEERVASLIALQRLAEEARRAGRRIRRSGPAST